MIDFRSFGMILELFDESNTVGILVQDYFAKIDDYFGWTIVVGQVWMVDLV